MIRDAGKWMMWVMIRGLPLLLGLVCLGVWLSQNRTVITREGEVFLIPYSMNDLSDAGGRTGGDSAHQGSVVHVEQRSVGTKVMMRKFAGLKLGRRGYGKTYTAIFPELHPTSSFLRDVNRSIKEKHVEEMGQFTELDWRTLWHEFRDPSPMNGWSIDVDTTVLHCTDRAASLSESFLGFTGGAHSNTWSRVRNFVNQNGKARELKLSNLFTPNSGWEEFLATRCTTDLNRQMASTVDPEAPDEPVEFTPVQLTTKSLDNFRPCSQSLCFDIEWPTHGGRRGELFTLSIRYSDLEPYLAKDSPARLFMQAEARLQVGN